MNIVIGSAFRNATGYLPRYFKQVKALQEFVDPPHHLRVIAAEGDSADNTLSELLDQSYAEGINLSVAKLDHGQPWFGSTEAPDRMKALSEVGNSIFDAVQPTDDVLVYVESDLIWDNYIIGVLIDHAVQRSGGFDVFAPMVFAGQLFYDIWGFRKDGERFGPFAPYHAGLKKELTEVDSVGSCLVMRASVARECRIRDGNCLVGWCADARAHGYKIAVEPRIIVDHPA